MDAGPACGFVDSAVMTELTRPASDVPPWLLDALLAVVVALAIALIIAMDQGGRHPPDLVAYCFAAGFGALMLLRRRVPRVMLAATVLGMFAYYAMGYPPIGVAVPVVAALFATADAGLAWWAGAAAALVFGVSMGFRLHDGESLAYLAGYEGVSNVALMATAIALGSSTHSRRVRSAQQAEIARLTAEQAALGERERISRDLHDTVGHAMSVISLQAGVASEAIGHDDTAAGRAVERIRVTSVQALRDMRSMIRLFRADESDGRQVLSLAGIPDLAEAARGTGLSVECDVRVRPDQVAPQVGVAAYRIVQESLTNVIRHAGATRVGVTAHLSDGTLHLTITDNGSGGHAAAEPGTGLTGMRERVHALGGTLTAGAGADAGAGETGFTVDVQLPARSPA
jgi:signal transduction histidine kinase